MSSLLYHACISVFVQYTACQCFHLNSLGALLGGQLVVSGFCDSIVRIHHPDVVGQGLAHVQQAEAMAPHEPQQLGALLAVACDCPAKLLEGHPVQPQQRIRHLGHSLLVQVIDHWSS